MAGDLRKMTAVSFLLALTGFAMLSLSMAKHQRDLLGCGLSRSWEIGLRCAGWLSNSASLASSIRAAGVSIGIVQWAAFLTLAALIVALALTYKEKWWRA